MKKTVIFILLIALLMSVQSCAKNPNDTHGSDVVDVNVSDSKSLPSVSLELTATDGQVACGDSFTLAKTVSGDILFTGNCAAVFREKDKLADSAYITAYEKTAACIKKNGTVCIIGENKELFSDAEQWTDIVNIFLSHDFMLGLNKDGKVLSCGRNSYGKCETADLSSVLSVATGRNHFAALLSDGSVIVRGAYSDEETIKDWNDVKEIACGEFSVVAVTSSGDLLTYHADDVKDWENVRSISSYGKTFAALTDEGILSNKESYNNVQEKDIQSLSLGGSHMALTLSDGTVRCFGSKNDMQCATDDWHLGVSVDNGYITGFSEKTEVSSALSLIKAATGKNVKVKGKKANAEYISTGAKIIDDDGKAIGTVIIYGDVNGDGLINSKDSSLMKSHISGKKMLKGVYEKAAHVLHYLSDVKDISTEEVTAVTEHAAGYRHIDQHIFDPYADDITKYNAINTDTVGYVRVPGTKIDNPIMYGEGYYYHERNIYKNYSSLGAIYSIHDSYTKNNVVIGHNARASGKMFHGLHDIQDRGSDLLTLKNRIINLTVYHEYSTWELYALYETGHSEPVSTQLNNLNSLINATDEEIQEWIDAQIERSTTKLGVDDVTYEDTLLTLYTCGDVHSSDPDAQSRLYLFFRRIG